jgi:serine/threonine protein kinase
MHLRYLGMYQLPFLTKESSHRDFEGRNRAFWNALNFASPLQKGVLLFGTRAKIGDMSSQQTKYKRIGSYIVMEQIGKGQYSSVFRAKHVSSGDAVAIKTFERNDENSMAHAENEIQFLRSIEACRNVVNLHCVLASPNRVYVVEELAAKEDLFERVSRSLNGLPERMAAAYFSQLVDAVGFIHSKDIIHWDIKPENCLLSSLDCVLLSDFGLATSQVGARSVALPRGTAHYVAPEVLDGNVDDPFKVDIWSCGVVLFFLLTGERPFEGSSDVAIFTAIRIGKLDFPDHVSSCAASLIEAMLSQDPYSRPSVAQIKSHSFLCPTATPHSKRHTL